MRLEHGQHAIASDGFCGRERGANFRRMMRVIVHEQETLARVFDFEAAARVLKMAQRSRDLGEGHAQLGGERDHAERVAHIMPAGHVQDRFAELLAFAVSAEDAREILQLEIGSAVIGVGREPIGDGARPIRAKTHGVLIIRAVEDVTARLVEQLIEDGVDRAPCPHKNRDALLRC